MERHKQSTIGPLRAVPCPWCGTKMNLRELNAQYPIEDGCKVDCDACSHTSDVVGVDGEPRIILKQRHK
jgi:hypothetical protein